MILAHKIRLYPTSEQETALKKAAGCSRFAYNWGLAKWKEMYVKLVGNNTLPRPLLLNVQ